MGFWGEERAPDPVDRYKPCVAFDGESSFYSIGGYNNLAVSRYDTCTDLWTIDLPHMNMARNEASACIFDSHLLYVVGGQDDCDKVTGSIEKLDLRQVDANWIIFEIPSEIMVPRGQAAITALNKNEIAILGGYDEEIDCLTDVVILDPKTDLCTVAVKSETQPNIFIAIDNQAAQFAEDRVMFLGNGQSRDFAPLTLMEWKKGETVVNKLHKFDH